MKAKLILMGTLLALALIGCGKDGEFDYLFDLPNRAGGDTSVVQGIWRMDLATEAREIRAEVGKDYIILAGKCTNDGQSVVVGQRVAAEVTGSSVTLKEAVSASKMDGNFGCKIEFPATTFRYTRTGGQATLTTLGFVTFTKIADLSAVGK